MRRRSGEGRRARAQWRAGGRHRRQGRVRNDMRCGVGRGREQRGNDGGGQMQGDMRHGPEGAFRAGGLIRSLIMAAVKVSAAAFVLSGGVHAGVVMTMMQVTQQLADGHGAHRCTQADAQLAVPQRMRVRHIADRYQRPHADGQQKQAHQHACASGGAKGPGSGQHREILRHAVSAPHRRSGFPPSYLAVRRHPAAIGKRDASSRHHPAPWRRTVL